MSSNAENAVQIGTSITTNRRANLEFLVNSHGSQKSLAEAVPGAGITQPMISLMLSKKRWLSKHEARKIEIELKIPSNWLDRVQLRDAWGLWRKFRELSPEHRSLFNEMQSFIDERGVRIPRERLSGRQSDI